MSDNNPITPNGQSLLASIEAEDLNGPLFDNLFDEEKTSGTAPTEKTSLFGDLSKEKFADITNFESSAKPYFQDPDYYKSLLTGMGAVSGKIHKTIQDYLKTETSRERSLCRTKLIPLYWELVKKQAARLSKNSEMPKRLLIRFGVLLPNLLSLEQREILSKIIFENDTGEPIHYADEWLLLISEGEISPLTTDEDFSYRKKTKEPSDMKRQLEKIKGGRESHILSIKGYESEQKSIEQSLIRQTNEISRHRKSSLYQGLLSPYNQSQRATLDKVIGQAKKLQKIDKDIKKHFDSLKNYEEKLQALERATAQEAIDPSIDSQATVKELESIRQLTKLAVGKMGNHLPILMKPFFYANIKEVATRENVIALLAQIESIDPGVFTRTFKQQIRRIVPHVILLPCLGDKGVCWEPFEKGNKATGRGRIGIPMFPKNLREAVLAALADLRWRVAKEKAQHHWKEEGVTGHY